ncbi:MAG: hypothetical protein K2K45_05345 [Muribaculaceae bacterium]|nr:hypothetical protein [Muribaculaceae bacterium]
MIYASVPETALDRINYQHSIYPQEKLHVVTDRDIYCGGDTIWLRVFVVDAATHQQTAMSKYAYVELLNPFEKVEKRIKLIERDGVYAGYIPIKEDIFEGDYTISAYTAYSENQGKDYFFRKPIHLLAPHSSKYSIETEFTPTTEGEVSGKFVLNSLNGDKMNYNIMSWTMPNGKFLEMPDSKKGFTRKFKSDKNEDIVLVKFGDYGKYIRVEYPSEETEVNFYPEGGRLIADEPCTVAFKAKDENGKGVDVSGIIRNDSNEEITRFSTSHCGMGSFTFIPESGKNYTAEYKGQNAEKRIIEIGSPEKGAVALRYRYTGSKCIFSVSGGQGKDLELIIACRGIGLIATPISHNTPLSIEKSDLPTGLYQAMLFSRKDNAVLSERLFFIGADRIVPEVSSVSADSLYIMLSAMQGDSVDCSVRITNKNIVPVSNENDIRSQLLLQGELRGRIENPKYYFKDVNRETEQNLDLLMMVNGWSRYNLPEVVLGNYTEPEIPLEIGQDISGQVLSRWKGTPLKNATVSVIAKGFNFATFTNSDENGEFHLDGFDFPENTSYIIKAMNEKGGDEGDYVIYDEKFPSVEGLSESSNVSLEDVSDYFKGYNNILLDEIKVQAFSNKEIDFYESLAKYSRDYKDLEARGVSSLSEIARNIPGMTNYRGYLRWRKRNVAYYIDGTMMELASRVGSRIPTLSDIESILPIQAIKKICFIEPQYSLSVGPHYGGGILMLTTKDGTELKLQRQFELKDYLPLGYQKYKEYASPMLSVDADEYDMQTQPTLLWIPSVKFDKNGKTIDLKFPVNSNHQVIIEGVTDKGDIISETL